jgi:hypothetical protein
LSAWDLDGLRQQRSRAVAQKTGFIQAPRPAAPQLASLLLSGRATGFLRRTMMGCCTPLGGRAIHVLKYLEKAVHPRWPMTFEVAKRAVGVMVLLFDCCPATHAGAFE